MYLPMLPSWLEALNNTTQFLKWAKGMNKHFPKEDKWVARKDIKRCSISSVMKKTEIKTTRIAKFE